MKRRLSLLIVITFCILTPVTQAYASTTIYFGSVDHIGTVNPYTGSVQHFDDLGASGYVTSLNFSDYGTLYGYVAGTGIGTFNSSTGSFDLIANPGGVNSLALINNTIYFGSRDHIGTVNPDTGTVHHFNDLGLNGYVTAMDISESGTLYGYVAGTGIGTFDLSTGSFDLIANPGSSNALTLLDNTIIFGGQDHIGSLNPVTGELHHFDDLGLNGHVTSLDYSDSGVLYGYVAGTGIGTFNPSTGGFELINNPGSVTSLTTSTIEPIPAPSAFVLTCIGILCLRKRSRIQI